MDLEFTERREWGSGDFPFGAFWDDNLRESLIGFGSKYGVVDFGSGNGRQLKKYPFLPDNFKGNGTAKLNHLDYAMDMVTIEITEKIRALVDAAIQNPDLRQRDAENDVEYVESGMLYSAALGLDELLLLNEMLTAAIQGRLDTFVTPRKADGIGKLLRRFGLQGLRTLSSTGGAPIYDLAPCYIVLNAYFIMTEVDKQGEFRRIHLPNESMTVRDILRVLRPDSRFQIENKTIEEVHGSLGAFLNYVGGLNGKFFPIYLERPTTEEWRQTGGFFLAPEGSFVQKDMRPCIPFSNRVYRRTTLTSPHRIGDDFGAVKFYGTGVTSTAWHRNWWQVRGSAL